MSEALVGERKKSSLWDGRVRSAAGTLWGISALHRKHTNQRTAESSHDITFEAAAAPQNTLKGEGKAGIERCCSQHSVDKQGKCVILTRRELFTLGVQRQAVTSCRPAGLLWQYSLVHPPLPVQEPLSHSSLLLGDLLSRAVCLAASETSLLL